MQNLSKSGTEAPLTTIAAPRGLVPLNLHELWEYRELAFFMLWRDIKGRYRQMALGPLWILFSPLINVLINSIIFGYFAKFPSDDIPYPLFNYCALLMWAFFSGSLFGCANSLLQYKDLIAKVYFPRLVVPLVGVFSALFDFVVSFIILIGMMFYYGYAPGWGLVAIPSYLALAASTGLAVGLWCASWIVHFRDVGTILNYIARGWMFASPVVYAVSLIPAKWRGWYYLNPMASAIDGFRAAVLGTDGPPLRMVWIAFALVVPLLIGGAYYFRKTERSIVDIA
jgi:lipopolysaccharide transport system permease protein